MVRSIVLISSVFFACNVMCQKIVIWNDSLKQVATVEYLQADIRLNDLKKVITKNGRYIVYNGKNDIDKNHVFSYDPLERDFRWYEHNDLVQIIFDNVKDTSCSPKKDPLPDGTWILVEKRDTGICKIYEKGVLNQLLDGKFIHWEGGKMIWKETYRSGFFVDTAEYFSNFGNRWSLSIFTDTCGILRESISYYDAGQIMSYYNINLGKVIYFYEDGTIRSIDPVNRFLHSIGNEVNYSTEGKRE